MTKEQWLASSAYAIVLCIVTTIGVAMAIYYYTSYNPPSVSDWIKDGVHAGCTATTINEYGIPTSICPIGVIENITIEKI